MPQEGVVQKGKNRERTKGKIFAWSGINGQKRLCKLLCTPVGAEVSSLSESASIYDNTRSMAIISIHIYTSYNCYHIIRKGKYLDHDQIDL